MHVVHIPRRFVRSAWGGTETVILETSKRLRARGHEADILCPNALADRDAEVVEGVPVERVPYFYPYWGLRPEARNRLDRAGGNLFSFALLRALRRREQLDLIHLHTANRVGGIGRYAARRRRIPYVVTLHGGVLDVPADEAATLAAPTRGAFEWGRALGWWVGSRRVYADAAAIICVGAEEQRRMAARFPQKRVVHLPNGVDADRFATGDGAGFRRRHGIPAAARVVLVAGRIDPQKNQDFALRVFAALRRERPQAHLLLVGHVTDPAYGERIETDVCDAGLGDHVTIIPGLDGRGDELVDAYHAADVFLLPSRHEPFGIVILEAWAAGRPVVASCVGGVPGFVADGEDALLFDVNDERACLAALRALLDDPWRATAVAAAGQAKARNEYSWDHITDRLVALYEDVRGENPLRP